MSNRQMDRRTVFWCSLAIWLASVAYALITPPFQVPDEVAHYWHSVALAHGSVFQETQNGRLGSYVPRSARDLVYLTWVATAGQPDRKVGVERLRAASQLPFEPERVFRSFPALYTPVPYLPAAVTCFVADLLHIRALSAFYAGRVVTATVAVLLIAAAMLECGELGALIAAIASLPMALFLFGSYSSDALTIAIALYVAAIAWRVRSEVAVNAPVWMRLCVAAALLAMCKSVYAPIALLAIAPRQRGLIVPPGRMWRILLVFGSLILGLSVSALVLARQYYPMRTDADPRAQVQSIEAHPIRVAGIVLQDYKERWSDYRDQSVGRLGWADVPLSGVLTVVAFYLLVAVAATSSVPITLSARLFTALVAILVCIGVSVSQFVIWTPPGARLIEGIQGRYFLPVAMVLLLLFTAAVRHRSVRLMVLALYVVTALAINVDALVLLVNRYY